MRRSFTRLKKKNVPAKKTCRDIYISPLEETLVIKDRRVKIYVAPRIKQRQRQFFSMLLVTFCCIRIFLLSFSLSITMASVVSTPRRVAVVTGGNKGIGKEIVRKLSTVPDLITILGSRDLALGVAAAKELASDGCMNIICHQLDITDQDSINKLRLFLSRDFGKLDILINNAAICYNDPTLYGKVPYTSFQQQVQPTINVNFFGTLRMTQVMLPLLKSSSSPRIINVASAAGRLSILNSQQKLATFTSSNLQVSDLEEQMLAFVRDVENGSHRENGWPNTCYGMSKLAIIALTKVLARDDPMIAVNSVDPG